MIHKKSLALIFGALILLPASLFAQFQTVTSSGTAPTSITIPAGQVMRIYNFTHDVSTGRLELTKGNISLFIFQSVGIAGGTGNIANEPHFAGPATVTMTGNTVDSKLCLSYKLFENATAAGVTTPSSAVVIPADAAGPVNIILESSTDLITWTAAVPGSYGSATTKRFFRVRAVSQ